MKWLFQPWLNKSTSPVSRKRTRDKGQGTRDKGQKAHEEQVKATTKSA
jgi:hypothetical protein